MPINVDSSSSATKQSADAKPSVGRLVLLIAVIVIGFGFVIYNIMRSGPGTVVISGGETFEAQQAIFKAIEDPPEKYPHISIASDSAAGTVNVSGSVPTKADLDSINQKIKALGLKVKVNVDVKVGN